MSLTKRAIDAAKPPESGETVIWDDAMPGFCCRVRASGARLYYLKTRVKGRVRWFAIGRHGAPWTVETARREARRLLGEIVADRDPAAERDVERRDPTVAELCGQYLGAAQAGEIVSRLGETKKASTLATDRGRIERHIKPLLGKRKVRDVTQIDVRRFLADVASGKTAADIKTGKHGRAIVEGGKGTASRTVGLLGGIFTFAVKRGLRADNPVRGVERYRDRQNERYLSAAELAQLGETLSAAEQAGDNPTAIAAIRLLILTGCRKSEILTLEWRHVDFEHACLRLPTSKTGAKTMPLGAPALELLASLPRLAGNPYVLPGERSGGFFVGLPKAWERIRARAGLEGFRLHDLRHSFASVGAAGGDSLLVIGRPLGHRGPRTSPRYAHVPSDPAKAAADRIASRIAAAMQGKPADAGNVVALKPKAG
ncbi:MAG: DUF4102 domain-containing protein [Alphaproteobacteria bacterium]|nr:DUF4102 domain-containing protein [Alphaproteobacteria bacterium]